MKKPVYITETEALNEIERLRKQRDAATSKRILAQLEATSAEIQRLVSEANTQLRGGAEKRRQQAVMAK